MSDNFETGNGERGNGKPDEAPKRKPDKTNETNPVSDNHLAVRAQVDGALSKIEEIAKGAENATRVLQERARRATNRAELIRRVALGEFVPDLQHATAVHELIATGKWDEVNFDLTTLFGAQMSDAEMKTYLASFQAPRNTTRHPLVPSIRFPMALGLEGDPREYDDFTLGTYSSMDHIKRRENELPPKKMYHLTEWGHDFVQSWGLGYTPLVDLPVLEDPMAYKSIEELPQQDQNFGRLVLAQYEKKIRFAEAETTFKKPLIKRMMVVMPGSRKEDGYYLEFLPEIQFPQQFPAKSDYSFEDPYNCYDPSIVLGGKLNDCANLVKGEKDTSNTSRRILLDNNGREAMFRIASFGTMGQNEAMDAMTDGTVHFKETGAEFVGNRIGILLLPGVSQYQKKKTFFSHGLNEFSPFTPRTLSKPPSKTVHEASITAGSTSTFGMSSKDAGYNRVFGYLKGGQPVIHLVRYVTAVRD